jgi:hypothetical protein
MHPNTATTPNDASSAMLLAVASARACYARAFPAWAADLVRLRASKMDIPSARRGDADLVSPFRVGGVPIAVTDPGRDFQQFLRWPPVRSAA